jgi:hypothetical protein
MPDELLALALEQAERSEPTVRVAALLRIARVESAVDRQNARKTFERALAETKGITGVDGSFLLARSAGSRSRGTRPVARDSFV